MSNIKLPVQIITKKIAMPGLEVFYPSIAGGTNSNSARGMNRQIYNLVNSIIAQQGYYQQPYTTQVNGYYEIKTNERGVLSLSIINYTYHQHAAHGLTIIKSLNFDINTGKNYQLQELFKPETSYVQILSDIIKKQIKQRDVPVIEEFKEIKPDQDYYIADKALVIYFQLYELTPYVYGFPQFPISVYEIADIIKQDGILGVMLINM